jgi:predicted dehydrogenase
VEAYGRVVYPDRVTKEGEPFTISTPEFVVAIVELAAGPIVRLTGSWYVMQTSKQEGIEFHGDDGSLYLASWLKGDGGVEFAPLGEPYRPVSLVRPAEKSVVWSRAVADLARAIAAGRPHRADGEQAAHLVEIMDAVNESMQTGRPVEVRSDFTPPAPMDWAG